MSHRVAILASRVAVVVFWIMAAIQVAIAVGVLPVTIVWGGSQQERTLANSLASVVAAAILVGMALVIHQRASMTARPSKGVRIGSWMIAAYMVLNTLGNLLSTSLVERYIFGTMTIGMAISCFVVASAPISEADPTNYETLP